MLGVVIPVIESELEGLYINLDRIQLNLELANIDDYKIVVVLQTKDINIQLREYNKTKFKVVSYYSVSQARNIGLNEISKEADYIYLLDQDATPSVEFFIQAKNNMSLGLSVWSGKINWIADRMKNKGNQNNGNQNKGYYLSSFFVPLNTFLGCYIFKAALIRKYSIRFNQNLGPAENTQLKTGEDVYFLCEFFSKNKIGRYIFYPKLQINHPERPRDNSKSILYLDGQVAIYKNLLLSHSMNFRIRMGAFLYLILFTFNGFLKFIRMEENGYFIFKKRLYSLFYNKYEILDNERKK